MSSYTVSIKNQELIVIADQGPLDEQELRRRIAEDITRAQNDRREQTREQVRLARQQRRTSRQEQRTARAQEEAAEEQEEAAEAMEDAAPGTGITEAALGSRRGRLRSVASGAWGGVGSVGAGARTAGNHITNNSARYFFLIIAATHIGDLYFRYAQGLNSGGFVNAIALWYIIISLVIAPLLLNRNRGEPIFFNPRTITFAILGVLSIFLPLLISYLPEIVKSNSWFNLVILTGPPWILYLIFAPQGDEFLERIRGWWIGLWSLLLIALMLTVLVGFDFSIAVPGRDLYNPFDALAEISETLTEGLSTVWGRLVNAGAALPTFLNRNLDDALGTNYQGQVDPYTQGQLGLRFENLRARDRAFFEGAPVVVWVDIRGDKGFSEDVILGLRCYALDAQKNLYEGKVQAQAKDPTHIEVTRQLATFASCTFDDPTLPKGRYSVFFAGTFNFKTKAYIQYYFSPLPVINDLWANNVEPSTEFDIEQRPTAIFTSGPVTLGMASEIDQPIAVDSATPGRGLPPIGASLQNAWLNGEISSVNEIKLLVPEPFKLERCDRDPASSVGGTKEEPGFDVDMEPGYKTYIFDNIAAPNVIFESVTCFLTFNSDEEAVSFLGDFDLVLKTFVSESTYLYTIEENIKVEVS